MDINIRKMLVGDIEDVLEIEREAFSTPWSREAFRIEIEENLLAKYFVAEVDKRPIGYGGMWLILNECHITNIAVKKAYRGKGVGKKILEAMILFCDLQGIQRMTLEVRKSNVVAQSLYKKYDFIEQGIRPKYYTDNNEDAVIMWRLNE